MTNPIEHLIPFGERATGIGGTDAKRIADGDWLDLWEEKMGLKAPVNLDHVFKVQLGLVTEPLHARWYAKQTGHQLADPGNSPMTTKAAPEPFMFATLDRWVVPLDHPLEMKHTNERNSLEDCAVYYMAQIQHQMMVAGRSMLTLSIIRGNNEPVSGLVSRDEAYCQNLLAQERAFWRYVELGEAPPAAGIEAGALDALAITVPINGRKAYDLGADNRFVELATQYKTLKPSADAFKLVDKEIREKIPHDASTVTGGGITLKRDARGAFRLTILEEDHAA